MDSADSVEGQVRRRLAPDSDLLARVERARTALAERATAAARERSSRVVRCLVAGSAARGTFLPDRVDLDFFLLFPPTLSREELETEGLALARAILPDGALRYAEHPYLRGTFEGFAVDAVPGYAISDPAQPMSAVDRTPFHQEYLLGRLTPRLIDDVRLTKQFLRCLGVYGAEAKTGGFSGYLSELLVVRFGGFHPFLDAARSWRIPVRLISAEGATPRVPDDVGLILDDPVDPHRNVASALSRRNLGLLIVAAGAYLDRPSGRWFELPAPRRLGRSAALERTTERGTAVTSVTLERPELVDDILYPQVRKAERAFAAEAKRAGFEVVGSSSAVGPSSAVVLLETTTDTLAPVKIQDGPPAGIDRVGHFLEKWTAPNAAVLSGPFVDDDGRLMVHARRAERKIGPILAEAIPRLSLGKDLRPPGPEKIQRLADTPEGPPLEEALAELLDRSLPWLRRP